MGLFALIALPQLIAIRSRCARRFMWRV